MDQLINHFGDHHRVIHFYVKQARNLSSLSCPSTASWTSTTCGRCERSLEREEGGKNVDEVTGLCGTCEAMAGQRITVLKQIVRLKPQVPIYLRLGSGCYLPNISSNDPSLKMFY